MSLSQRTRLRNLVVLLTMVLAVLWSEKAIAQDLEWAKQAGGTLQDVGRGIAMDTSGNSYVTGLFNDTVVFGASEPNETTLISYGGPDIFVAKYDSDGHLVWVKQAGGALLADGLGIAVDTSGNSYVIGRFEGTAVFGASEPNETTLVNASGSDIFVAKYDSDGHLVWVKQAGGTGSAGGFGLGMDGSGNIYITGTFNHSATFGASEPNETTLVSAGSNDIFVAKYDANGGLLWAKQAGGAVPAYGLGIAVDTSGNSYVTGQFYGTAVFGALEPNETTLLT
jgi:hypothetical protein